MKKLTKFSTALLVVMGIGVFYACNSAENVKVDEDTAQKNSKTPFLLPLSPNIALKMITAFIAPTSDYAIIFQKDSIDSMAYTLDGATFIKMLDNIPTGGKLCFGLGHYNKKFSKKYPELEKDKNAIYWAYNYVDAAHQNIDNKKYMVGYSNNKAELRDAIFELDANDYNAFLKEYQNGFKKKIDNLAIKHKEGNTNKIYIDKQEAINFLANTNSGKLQINKVVVAYGKVLDATAMSSAGYSSSNSNYNPKAEGQLTFVFIVHAKIQQVDKTAKDTTIYYDINELCPPTCQ